jgi:thioredoxin reductase (NADPH)
MIDPLHGSGDFARGVYRYAVVIGGGPAGVAAAIQLKRGGLEPLLVERDRIGGLLREANLIENYPGFPDGIAGRELADLLAAHAGAAGVDIAFEEVSLLGLEDDSFEMRTSKGIISADIVVVASGTSPSVLRGVDVLGAAAERIHYGVQDIDEVRGGRMVVIGGGDAAFDYALSLAERDDVEILHRGGRPRCIPVLEERCGESARITYRPGVTVEAITAGGDGVTVRCAVGAGGEREEIAADHVVVAIGRAPCLDFLGADVRGRIDELGKEKRLYLVGDVINGTLRQAAISVGDGVRAAMEIVELFRAAERRESGRQ